MEDFNLENMEDFNLENLVSNEYRALIEERHSKWDGMWGGHIDSKIKFIYKYALEYDCKSILDYGAGSRHFIKGINTQYPNHSFIINEYEPGRKELAKDPPVSDMIVCLDVMEHIEPEKLDKVLEHINNKVNKIMYFNICTIASYGTFPNGQNLHLIIENKDWWIEKLSKYFTFKDLLSTETHIWGLAIKK
jgi:hypothetical protein